MAAGRMGAWDLNLHTGDATWDARQCELFGQTMDRPLRRAEEFYNALHPDDVEQVQEAARRAHRTGLFARRNFASSTPTAPSIGYADRAKP